MGVENEQFRRERRQLLKIAGLGGATVLGGAAVIEDADVLVRILKKTFLAEFVYGVDPVPEVEKREVPYDFVSQRELLKEPIQKLTVGHKEIVSYKELVGDVINGDTILMAEAHGKPGDKISAREVLYSIIKANPHRKIIVALGRAIPSDNEILKWYTKESRNTRYSEEDALDILLEKSSLEENWGGMLGYPDQSVYSSIFEYGKYLMMLRRFGLTTVGLGVDDAISLWDESSSQVDMWTDEDWSRREAKAADIIFNLERENPDAVIFATAGGLHASRGWTSYDPGASQSGLATRIETLHRQNPRFPGRRVLSIGTGHGSEDLDVWLEPSIKEILADFKDKLNNSVLAIKSPRYSLYYIGSGPGRFPVEHQAENNDYLLLRFYYPKLK